MTLPNNCVILAGGKSSRMKQDKTLLKFSEFDSLIEFCIHKYSKIFDNVFVSTKNDKFSLKLNLILDKFDQFSPMGAIYQILEFFSKNHLPCDKIFITPADMPFLSQQSINLLYENSSNCDIINPKDRSHTHFLCGFFAINLASRAKNLFENNIHKISNLAQISNHKTINFNNDLEFLNINYPKDYEKALQILSKNKF